jgi:hypothetical protein
LYSAYLIHVTHWTVWQDDPCCVAVGEDAIF